MAEYHHDKTRRGKRGIKKPGFFVLSRQFFLSSLWRPGSKDMFFYTLGLRSAITSGIPISSAFEVMGQSARHRRLQRASFEIGRELSAGISLEQAMVRHKGTFSPFFMNVFLTGLRSGSMEESLDILIGHYSALMELKSKVLQVIMYPMANILLGTLVMIVRDLILTFMNHAFSWREAMPIISRYGAYLFSGFILPLILSRVARDPRVRPVTDRFMIHVPVLGRFYKNYALAIFFRVFATCLETGREISSGFHDALEAMNNYHLAKRIRAAERYLMAGENISEAFYLTKIFDAQALSMVAVGESSGTMPDMCRRMADYYHGEIMGLLPGYIRAAFPFFMILVALAFFFDPMFLFIASFIYCFFIFLAV